MIVLNNAFDGGYRRSLHEEVFFQDFGNFLVVKWYSLELDFARMVKEIFHYSLPHPH